MSFIRTISKDIEPGDLGWCQCHEHIFIADGASKSINPALHIEDDSKSLAEVKLYKQAGGKSLVDAQPYGCGRMAEKLVWVNRETGVNIIASTGFHKTEFFSDPVWLGSQTEETLAEFFIEEIENGIYASNGIRLGQNAGIIKCAAVKGEHKADSIYAKLFIAAAHASAKTGAPVMIHMDQGADAMPLAAFFGEYGVTPKQLIFCHLDRTKYDRGYHEEVAALGAYLEYDTVHRLKYHSDREEAELIAYMVGHGHADTLLLSMDTTNKRLKSYGADFGLDFILTDFRFTLEEYMPAKVIEQIMINNTSKALSFKKV